VPLLSATRYRTPVTTGRGRVADLGPAQRHDRPQRRCKTLFKAGWVGAYQRGVKQELLEVSDGPLVSQECVSEMAMGAAALLSAHVGLAITGVGGPGPDEGHEAGTVWIAVHAPLGTRSVLYHLRGNSPDEVCAASCTQAA
jgi:nicotinamide-nucleotide amidase